MCCSPDQIKPAQINTRKTPQCTESILDGMRDITEIAKHQVSSTCFLVLKSGDIIGIHSHSRVHCLHAMPKTALATATRMLILLASPQLKGFLINWDQQLISLEAWQLPRNIVLSQDPLIRYWHSTITLQPLTQLPLSVIDTRLLGIARKHIHTVKAPRLLPDVDRAVLGSWHF